jgi:transcriptional regulator with XRE-family HTH domain
MSELGDWGEYIKKYSRGDAQGVIAEKMGVQSSTVGRWVRGETKQPEAEQAINFARKYDRSPVEALIHAGFIKTEEVGKAIEIAGSMRDVSDAALMDELAGRLARFRQILNAGDYPQDGLVSEDWSEDPGVGGMENSN